jgi:hypothetical protein
MQDRRRRAFQPSLEPAPDLPRDIEGGIYTPRESVSSLAAA